RREPDRELERRVLRVNLARRGANREWRFDPGAIMDPRRQVRLTGHGEQRHQRRLALAKGNGTPSQDDEMGGVCRGLDPRALLLWKHARKQPTGGEMPGGNASIILDVAADFEPAGHP